MNDDHLPESILRASAYLDGELDDAEMTLAEADPAVMAEVEQLRALQAGVADVDPPSDAVRERSIAAALAEFDQLHTVPAESSDSPAPARVVPFRPRPASTRWLTAAAAVVAVGVLGVVVAQSVGGDDESDAGVAASAEDAGETAAASATASESSSRIASETANAEMAMASDGAPEIAGDATAMSGDTASASESATATAIESATASESAPTEITTTAGGGTPSTTTIVVDPRAIVVDDDNLYAVGQQLLDQFEAGTLTTPETACTFGTATILAAGQFDADGTLRDVIITGDPATREIGAFDADTCGLIAFVSAP